MRQKGKGVTPTMTHFSYSSSQDKIRAESEAFLEQLQAKMKNLSERLTDRPWLDRWNVSSKGLTLN